MVSVLPTLYTEKEVAALFGCAPITVKRERTRGRLGYTLIAGRIIRYTQAHVDEYLRGNSCATTSSQGRAESGTSTGPTGASPYCDCGNFPGEEEEAFNRCSACGKRLDP